MLSKAEKEVQTAQSQTVTAAPALSRALARVLGATECKENEAEKRHPDSFLDDHTTGEEAGKTQWLWLGYLFVQYINDKKGIMMCYAE